MKKASVKVYKKNIEQVLSDAAGSLEVEGLKVKSEEIDVIRRYFNGEYTEKEVLEIIKNS